MSKSSKFSSSAVAVAFVWFTTHFGGGFASGRQLVEYYVKFGWYAVFMPMLAIGMQALVLYFTWDFCRKWSTFEYRGFANNLYKPYQAVFSNIFEVCYILLLLVATGVALATGGSVLEDILNIPYLIGMTFITVIVFLLTIFGADLVRAAATVMGLLIVIGLLSIYGVNVATNFENISKIVWNGVAPKGFLPALGRGFLYLGFQMACVGGYIAVADALKTRQDCIKAAVYGFIFNAACLSLATIAILGYYPDILPETLPALYVVKHTPGGSGLQIGISLLIFLAVITTGVSLVYGGVRRIVEWWMRGKESSEGVLKKNMIASALYIVVCWIIATAGLMPLVAKGYSFIGYISLPCIVLPILVKGIVDHRKENELTKKSVEQ